MHQIGSLIARGGSSRGALLLLGAALCTGGAAEALAGARTSLVILTAPEERLDPATELLTHRVATALAERYEVIDSDHALGDAGAGKSRLAVAEAVRKLDRAKRAFDRLEMGTAAQVLEEAIGAFDRNVGQVGDFEPVQRALELLAATRLLEGGQAEAQRLLSRLFVVAPHAEPDAKIFNPPMQAVFREMRARVKRSRGELVVKANVPAAVFVDGTYRGTAPLVITELAEGKHYVRVVHQRMAAWGKLVSVIGRVRVGVRAELEALPARAPADSELARLGSADAPDAMRRLAHVLGADRLLVVSRRAATGDSAELRLGLYGLRAGVELRSLTLQAAGAADFAELVRALAPPPITLCVADVRGAGAEPAAELAKRKLTDVVQQAGASVIVLGDPLEPTCLREAACLTTALADTAAHGILAIEPIRSGTRLRWQASLLHPATGEVLFEGSLAGDAIGKMDKLAEVVAQIADAAWEARASAPIRPAVSAEPATELREPERPQPLADAALALDLRREEAAPPAASRFTGWALLLGGLLATGAGGTMTYVSHQSWQDPYTSGHQKQSALTLGRAGVGTFLVGAFVSGVGGWLLVGR